MKKRLIVLVALMLCVVTVLASCASSMKLSKIVSDGTYNDEDPALTTSAKLDVKGEWYRTVGDLVFFRDVDDDGLATYTIYNLATGAVVYTVSDTRTESGDNYTEVENMVTAMEIWNTALIAVMTQTTTATMKDGDYEYDEKTDAKMLTATGTEIVALTDVKESQMMDSWQIEDLFCIQGKVYRIADDGSVAYAFDWSELRGEPEVEEKVGDFYFGESMDDGIAVYDANLNLVTIFDMPSYVEDDLCGYHLLSNGNVLIQYAVEQDWMTEEYDIMEEGTKYNLFSFLLDAEKGKVKDLDLDYIVMDVYFAEPGDTDWNYDEKVENFAWITYIEEQRVDWNYSAVVAVSLGNNGKVDGKIDDLIPNMGAEPPVQVAANRWIVANQVGQEFLLNEKGDVVGEITGVSWDNMTAEFFVMNNKIYDWDLNVKVDLSEQEIDGPYLVMDHSVLFMTEDEEVKIYANGEVKTLINKEAAEAGDLEIVILDDCTSVFMIVDTTSDSTVKVEIYNSVGAKIATVENVEFDDEVAAYADSTNAILLVGEDDEGDTVYYRIG